MVPHIILRLGFNGQLRADLRCHWPLRSSLCSSGSGAFIALLRRTSISKSVTKVKQLRTVSLLWCFLVGLSSAFLTSVSKEHSMSGHVSFALQVSFSPRFFQCVLHFTVRPILCCFWDSPSAPLCFRPYNGGKVLPDRSGQTSGVLALFLFYWGPSLFLCPSPCSA